MDFSDCPTAEEYHYVYDNSGRVRQAAFAQTSAAGFTPTGTNPWYDSTHKAASRARAYYSYDTGGRVTSVEHYWDIWGGSTYSTESILGNGCDYELSGLNRGLKTASRLYTRTTPGSSAWTLSQTDTYAYDASLDYLTGATYGDGLANATPTWSYDAAGNRNDAVTDNLNRATSVGGVTCTNDILGNRLSKGLTSYGWDALNRMTSHSTSTTQTSPLVTTNYVYRADGMRTSKSTTGYTTVYRYDGQMGMQDVETDPNSGWQKTTDYAVGARGLDAISTTTSSGTTVAHPICDAHGNMISTLSKSGTNAYTFTAVRTFDAWGVIRRGAASGDPKGRYCASLGHKQDDESGLVYMRARYYEPGSGRFLSEDPERKGAHWSAYCRNAPVNLADETGKCPFLLILGAVVFGGLVAGLFRCILSGNWSWSNFGVGFLEGAVITGAGALGGVLAGMLVGGIVGGLDAALSGRNILGGAFLDALGGGLGGSVSVVEAVAEEQVLLYLLLNIDIEAVDQEAGALNREISN